MQNLFENLKVEVHKNLYLIDSIPALTIIRFVWLKA